MLDQRRQHFQRVRPNDKLVVIGADVLGDTPRVMKLAEILFFKSDRKRLDPLTRLLAHQRHDGARVDPAGKKRTERHFRHQSHAHRLTQDLDSPLAGFFLADRELLREIRLPVTLYLDLTLAPAQPVSRLEFSNRPVRSQRRGDAHEREIVIEGFRLNVATDIRMKQQRTELGTEDEATVYVCIQQRLLTNSVARELNAGRLLSRHSHLIRVAGKPECSHVSRFMRDSSALSAATSGCDPHLLHISVQVLFGAFKKYDIGLSAF